MFSVERPCARGNLQFERRPCPAQAPQHCAPPPVSTSFPTLRSHLRLSWPDSEKKGGGGACSNDTESRSLLLLAEAERSLSWKQAGPQRITHESWGLGRNQQTCSLASGSSCLPDPPPTPSWAFQAATSALSSLPDPVKNRLE